MCKGWDIGMQSDINYNQMCACVCQPCWNLDSTSPPSPNTFRLYWNQRRRRSNTQRETHRERHRERDTQRETHRERETERDTHRETHRERQREREREGINGLFEKDDEVMFSLFCSERSASKLFSVCLWPSSYRVFSRPHAGFVETRQGWDTVTISGD